MVRLNKYLADCGIASRRQAEKLILNGDIKVNNKVCRVLSTKVSDKDDVSYRNRLVKPQNKNVYILLNKPVGYVCSTRRFKNEKSVLDLFEIKERVFPVGRLDKDSQGLLVLTNDGDLTLKLTHPRYEKEKEYLVEVNNKLNIEIIQGLRQKIRIDDDIVQAYNVKKLDDYELLMTLKEGKNRQIRKMLAEFGLRVTNLRRIRLNRLRLGDLEIGEWRYLSESEVENKLLN